MKAYKFVFVLGILSSCNKLESLKHKPLISPSDWCSNQPCIEVGNIIINQPSSSAIVYLLSLLSILIGLYFLKNHKHILSRKWWGISILIGGIGAFLAGTSYQAFGYELKCVGRQYCIWTNWLEISYEILTIISAGALLIAIAYSCFSKKWQKTCRVIAIFNTLIYLTIIIIGLISTNRFLLSFELMLCFIGPIYLVIMYINIIDYIKTREKIVGQLIISWIILFSTISLYYLYLISGTTQLLWKNGIWFSDNDVLHIGMIGWLMYIYLVLNKSLKDRY